MSLYARLNPHTLLIPLPYQLSDFCGASPFTFIRSNKQFINQFLPSETLIHLLQPPLSFIWRKIFFYWIFFITIQIIFMVIYFLIQYNQLKTNASQQPLNQLTENFIKIILMLVVLEVLGMIVCLEFFGKQLEEYCEGLNQGEIGRRELELYWTEGYCWGKNMNMLGIRRLGNERQTREMKEMEDFCERIERDTIKINDGW